MLSVFSYNFFQNAIIAGILIAFAGALVSPFLVLKGEAMLSDGISHSAFLGVVIGLLFSTKPIIIPIIISVIAGVLVKFLTKKTNHKADAIIGAISGFFIALGLIIISLSQGFNISLEALIKGDMLTISRIDLTYLLIAFVITFLFVVIFYKDLLVITFNIESSNVNKVKRAFLEYGILIISCVIIVVGIRLVGAFLVTSFIIFPALISQNLGLSFKNTVIVGTVISLLNVFAGLVISHLLAVPPGALIVVMLFLLFLISLLYKKIRRI